jgi:hypothetical protein
MIDFGRISELFKFICSSFDNSSRGRPLQLEDENLRMESWPSSSSFSIISMLGD